MANKIALITGASTGIGRALAHQFSQNGFGLLLVARDLKRLESVAEECRKISLLPVTFVALDLTDPFTASAIFDFSVERNLEIDVVVNNAGFGIHGEFSKTEIAKELELVRLQIDSFLQLTKLFLPQMRQRRYGHFLNIASVYSFVPVPQQAVYGACKSFMLSFSQSLASEVEPDGVSVTVVCPGVTQSEFRKRAGIREKKVESGMTAEAVAEQAFYAMRQRRRILIPGFWNKFFIRLMWLLPSRGMTALMKAINQKRGVN